MDDPRKPAGLVEDETWYVVVTEDLETRLKQAHAEATGEGESPGDRVTRGD